MGGAFLEDVGARGFSCRRLRWSGRGCGACRVCASYQGGAGFGCPGGQVVLVGVKGWLGVLMFFCFSWPACVWACSSSCHQCVVHIAFVSVCLYFL